MPDPSLVLLMQHLQRAPAAIVGRQHVGADAGSPAAFLQHAIDKERDCETYRRHGATARAEIWARLENGTFDMEPQRLAELIDEDDRRSIEEAARIRQFEKNTRRIDRALADDASKLLVIAAHQKLRATAKAIFEEGRDFALFLRAVRAEIDPHRTRDAFTTSDPKELRAFLGSA